MTGADLADSALLSHVALYASASVTD